MSYIPGIFDWHDCCEIILISIALYYVALWLKRDRTINLIGYFYAYWAIIIVSYSLSLTGIMHLTILFTPAIFMVFALAHQETLQKNLIPLKSRPINVTTQQQWLNTLLQTCLVIIAQKKSVRCIIEHTDQLDSFLEVPYLINAPLQQSLLKTLLLNPSYDENAYVWVSTSATLKSANVYWKKTSHAGWDLAIQANTPEWQKPILLHTAYTDAVVFYLDAHTHLFTLFAHGMMIEHISPHQAAQVISHHINQTNTPKKSRQQSKIGEAYAQSSTKNSHKQRTP